MTGQPSRRQGDWPKRDLLARPIRVLSGEVERILLRRIAEGRYQAGDRLPSCASLGREIGANKNTVSKAYQALSRRGYLSATPGRGTFVTGHPLIDSTEHFVDGIAALLTVVVENAWAAGIGVEELERVLGEEIRRRYDRPRQRIAFVECNVREAAKFSRQLSEVLGIHVEPLLLDDFLTDTCQATDEFDLIAVALSHLADVEERLRSTGVRRAAIVPLLTLPDSDALAEVARLAPETRLGVLAETSEARDTLAGFVQAFNPGVRFASALANDGEELATVVRSADVLLVTEAVHQHLASHVEGKPLIEAPFVLDNGAVGMLRQHIAQPQREAAEA